MEPFEHDCFDQKDTYPYQDYYSTGGMYRPPKQPRNHGGLFAFVGVLLLLFTGGTVIGRQFNQDTDRSEPLAAFESASDQEQWTEESQNQTVEAAIDREALLGTGMELTISDASKTELTLKEIYKNVSPSVVSISAASASGVSTGTGIIMSADGYIITNYHVVSNAGQVVVTLYDDSEYAATIVGGDETSDLLVLKVDAENLAAAQFGDSDVMEVGDSVVAIGDPLGTKLRGTMTYGIVCGINRDVDVGDRTMTMLQTDAALNSGNSGGPLINMQGQVIGINTMKITSQYSAAAVEGIGLAIPISAAKPIVDELVEKGYVTGRPAFGFTVETLNLRLMLYYNLPGQLCVQSVEQNSDAFEQGIRPGDIIVGVQGQSVASVDEFNTIKNQYVAGDTLTLTIYRDRQQFNVDVRLMDRAEIN